MSLPPVTFVGHSTVLLEVGGQRVLTDPVLGRSVSGLRRVAAPVDPALVRDVDVVLLSHLHADHLDLRSLRRLTGAVVVVPDGAQDWLRRRVPQVVQPLARGRSWTRGDLTVTATDCVHADDRRPGGPRAAPLGYLLEDASSRSYFPGDTDLHPQLGELGDLGIDLAMLPVWGWGPNLGPGHLDPRRAAQAVELLRPEAVVPIHWGTLAPPGLARLMSRQLTRPPHELADLVRAHGSATTVHVLAPGERAPW